MMSNSKVTQDIGIYCILCPSFHGATLLSLMLGNHSRMLALGDTIPTQPFPVRCGCGERFPDCDFWRAVRSATGDYQGREFFPANPMILPRFRLNAIALGLCGVVSARTGIPFVRGNFARSYQSFLDVCSARHSFDIFIDGYKSVAHYLALKASGFQVNGVIHLLRDPRAFAASAKRSKWNVERAARAWCRSHVDTITRYTRLAGERVMRVRYEDICAAPEQELKRIQWWMGVEPESIVHPIDPTIHWLGNISMTGFNGDIKPSQKWLAELTAQERSTVEKLTKEHARSFGYQS